MSRARTRCFNADWRWSRMPASIDTSAVPTPIFLSPFLRSSTFEWNDIVGCLPCADGCSCGPPGHTSRDFFAPSEMHARPVEEPELALESLEPLLLEELDEVVAL